MDRSDHRTLVGKILHKDAALNQNGGMDNHLLTAIFGLAGVLIGGLISWGTQYWLEKRKEK